MLRQTRLVLGAVVWAWLSRAQALPPAPPSAASGLITLTEAAAHEVVSAPLAPACTHTALTTVGRITYDDLRVAHVVSPVSGRVEQVLAKPGDALLARGVLATLRSPDFATARADWHKAQVALEAAKRDLARQDGLFSRHAAPEQVVLAAWDTYRRAVSEHDRARANLELLGGADVQGGTDVYQLRTPIAGVVVSRSLHAGMEVAGQYGGGAARELFLVADLSRVWVVAEVPEADLGRIGPHAEVVVHVDAVPDMPLTGTLDYIADTLDPALHTARVRCAVPNATGKLKPDMYATLTISAQGNKALAVPPKSIAVMADISFVFVEKPSQPGSRQFERRHVVVDAGDDDPLVSILHGVREGERVVTDGAQMLKALIEANP